MNHSFAGKDAPLQLTLVAADNVLCNCLLSSLRRDGLAVSATVITPTGDTTGPDCDLLLVVDNGSTGTGAFLARFRADQPGIPLLIAAAVNTPSNIDQVDTEVVPLSDLPRLQQSLKHHLCLQGERKRSHRLARQLHELEMQHLRLVAQSPVATALLDGNRHLYCNSSYAALFECRDRKALAGTPILDLVNAKDRAALDTLLNAETDGKFITLTPATGDAAEPLRLTFAASLYKAAPCIRVEARPAREKTGNPPGKDLITQLDNLPFFTERLESAITAAVNDNTLSLLLVTRIDRFRRVQETLGKTATLQVLTDIAGFLRDGISKPFTATRLAPDEFGILLFDSTAEEGVKLADYISSKVNVSLLPPTAEDIALSASIGLAVINQRAVDADDVIRRARMNTGNSLKHRSAGLSPAGHTQVMAERIRQALGGNRLEVLFQPVVAFRPNAGACFEATFNLYDSDGGILPRDSVLACANVQNTAAEIDKRVLDKILAEGGDAVYQVPLSSNTLANPALPGWLGAQLRKRNFPCGRLQFLVSEIDLHSNHDQVRDFCTSLAELGIVTVISDFGSALEPLPALAVVKPVAVRLDTLLTRDLLYSKQQHLNLGKLINAIHHQQVSVTATGLNDAELLPLLYELGVDFVQGDCLQPAQSEARFCFPEEQVITLPG